MLARQCRWHVPWLFNNETIPGGSDRIAVSTPCIVHFAVLRITTFLWTGYGSLVALYLPTASI